MNASTDALEARTADLMRRFNEAFFCALLGNLDSIG